MSAASVPEPVTCAETERVRMYVAVTVRACDIVSEHGPLELVHAPDHPLNRHPEAALLEMSTLVPSSKVAVDVPAAASEIPAGFEVVVPLPTWVTSSARNAVRDAVVEAAEVAEAETPSTVQ